MKADNYNPNEGTSLSQTKAILAYMKAGHRITDDECRRLFNCNRLGARIMDIEKIVGYPPLRHYIKVVGKDAQGNPRWKRVKEYWLHPEEENS